MLRGLTHEGVPSYVALNAERDQILFVPNAILMIPGLVRWLSSGKLRGATVRCSPAVSG